ARALLDVRIARVRRVRGPGRVDGVEIAVRVAGAAVDRDPLAAALHELVVAERGSQRDAGVLEVRHGVGERLLDLRAQRVQPRRRVDRIVRVERGREDRKVAGHRIDRGGTGERPAGEAPEQDRPGGVEVVVEVPARQHGTGGAYVDGPRTAQQVAAGRVVAELHQLVPPQLARELAVVEDVVLE